MSKDQFQFDTAHSSASFNFVDGLRAAKKSGKGMASLIAEIAKLRMGLGKLRPDEYFMYGLYDDNRYTPEAKRSFLSQDQNLLQSPWARIANDKPLLTAMLKGLGLPVPHTQAILHPARTFSGATPLRNRKDLCQFLRADAQYPIFGKPFDSICSMGTAKVTSYEADQDAVAIGGDRLIPVENFADMIESLGHAYMFQTLMLPHDEISKLIGPSVSSVRMFVISDEEGCSLFRAAWKIPATANDADNFWRAGNMLAGIDVETGEITKSLVRNESGGTDPIDAHPITGAEFGSMVFPQWDQMRETVLAAAVNLADCPFQGWDVAMTDQGPILVELEGDGGNPIMEQICFDSGLLTERYQRVVERAEERKKAKRNRDAALTQANFRKNLSEMAVPRSKQRAEPADDAAPAAQANPAAAAIVVSGAASNSASVNV